MKNNMKNNAIIATALFLFAFNANAGITVYDAQSGQKKDAKYLIQQDALIPAAGELTEEQFRTMKKSDFIKYIKQVPDENKPVEQQKLSKLGTVLFFTDLDSLDNSLTKVMNSVNELKEVRVVFYLKELKASSAYMLVSFKTNGKLKAELAVDSGNKVARRLHVDSYPQMIYLMPDKNQARYSGSNGGLAALKMRIGELKTLQELQAKEQAEQKARDNYNQQIKIN
jgi:hypothetical protein